VKPILLTFLAIAAFCLSGCKRHNGDSGREAINGAFGWALGARLPAAFEVETNSGSLRYSDPRGNVPPFNHVALDLTTNRTICAITGTLTGASPELCQTLQQSLTASLKQKYPFQKQSTDGGVTRVYFGEPGREVILATTAQPPTLALCYRDTAFVLQAQQEMAALNPGTSSTPTPGTGK
jgi:hypothetical protein